MVYFIYALIDSIVSLFGITPSFLSDYESIGTGALIISLIIRTPIYLVYSVAVALLTNLFMVIPALYFENKEVISWKIPYEVLRNNFKRYFLAGLFFNVCLGLGFLFCIIPGIVISLTSPAYVNKIACSNMPILKAFTSSFQSVFKSPNLWSYIGMQFIAGFLYLVPTLFTCGIGSIITLPMLSIYSQHLAYNKGILN